MPKLTKFSIRTKLLVIFISTLFIAIGGSSFLWLGNMRSILQKEVTSKQNQLGARASEKTVGFLDAKKRALIIHSQSAAFLAKDIDLQKLDLSIFLTQDHDIKQLTVIDLQGKEMLKLNRDTASFAPDTELQDRSQSPSFIANTFRYTKEYIGEVEFSESGDPFISISIPIKTPIGSQSLTDLKTQSTSMLAGSNDLVLGVLEAKVGLNNLFSEITDLGQDHDTSFFLSTNKAESLPTAISRS